MARAAEAVRASVAALLILALGGYGFVGWRRWALDALKQEASSQELRLANLKTPVAEMEKARADLDARSARFQTTFCGGDGRTKGRLCVAIDPAAPTYSAPGGAQYRVPMGFWVPSAASVVASLCYIFV